MTRNLRHGALAMPVIVAVILGRAAAGQQPQRDVPVPFAGPPAPVPPAVIARDAAGHTTIRAVALTSPLRLDGRLDEAFYADVPAISEFVQNDPQENAPASETTELWVLFDRNNVYVAARCWESRPERLIVNEMRRDSVNVVQNDGLGFSFDPFYDRRNAFGFEVNAIGGRIDGHMTNERQMNIDWNPIWDVKVGRFEGGWSLEAAVPFKSLRYRAGRTQIWGFNARRTNKWRNETSYLSRVPASMANIGHLSASLMATLVGLEVPSESSNLEVKPYGTSHLSTDRTVSPPVSNHVTGDFGVDAKYGITQSLTADLTYNTDFAQVEADEAQVNLTRFSLFFPEKRDFFLENQGTFGFGGVGGIGPGGGGGDTPQLFYSRRIGLSGTREVPIQGGGRLTGRVNRYSLGLLSIRTGEETASTTPATTFSVARLRRDILRKSSVGVIFTGRSVDQSGAGSNEAYGVDGTFGFYDNLFINTYWATTHTDGRLGDEASYRGQLDYRGDRYGVQVEHLAVGANFNPEVGFLRRSDIRRSLGQFRFSPRPRGSKRIRRFFSMGSLAYIENGKGRVEYREGSGEFAIEFQNSDRWFVAYARTYEFLPAPFPIASGVTLPLGGYEYGSARTGFNFGQQRQVAGNLSIERGTFYNGRKTTFAWNRGRVNVTPQLSIEPRFSVDWVDLVEGSFTSRLVGSRVTYTVSPLMFISGLLQYSSAGNAVSANVRLRWEYRPGSELFLVWNEQRDTRAPRFPDLANRALIVKINRLLRF